MKPINLILAFLFLFSFAQADPPQLSQGTSKNYRVIPPITREQYLERRKEQRNTLRTIEINRTTKQITTYENGKAKYHRITVVTYCDNYSDGTIRIWTRTF
jgi:hypothetical protein